MSQPYESLPSKSPATLFTVLRYIGFVLNLAIGGLVIMAGSGKLGEPTPEVEKMLDNEHMLANLKMLGIGEFIVGLLLIVPWTSSLGALLMCGFFGGTIVFHMARGEPYTMQSAFLLATIIGSVLRWPEMLTSFKWKFGQWK